MTTDAIRTFVLLRSEQSAAPARYLGICTPAGFERYFDRIAARQAGVDPPPEGLKPYPETTVVGPPLAP